MIGNDDAIVKSAFEDLSKLLMADPKTAQRFLKKHKHESMEDMDHAWEELFFALERKGKVIELDWKARKDSFIPAMRKLSAGLNLNLDEKMLNDEEDIPRWGKVLSAEWAEYVLSAMDIGSDSYAMMVLSKEDFEKARELAKVFLHRIAVIEEM